MLELPGPSRSSYPCRLSLGLGPLCGRSSFEIVSGRRRVAADGAPDVPPFAGALQLLETLLFARFEAVGFFLVEAQRDTDVHLDHGEHDLSSSGNLLPAERELFADLAAVDRSALQRMDAAA